MKTQKMTCVLFLTVMLYVISHNSVFTQLTLEPEMSETCELMCGSEVQEVYNIITNIKDNMKGMQSQIHALETNEVRDLTEQNENLLELNTKCTNITEHQQTEIDDLKDKNNAFKGNICFFYFFIELYSKRFRNDSKLCTKQ